VFFPEIAAALDEDGVDTFEIAAKQLVVANVNEIEENLFVARVNVKDVKVVSQVFAWHVNPKRHLRALESTSTGLDVYFQVVAQVTGYTTAEVLEFSIQQLFDSNNAAFRRSLESFSTNTEKKPLNSIHLTLGIAAGCSGLVAAIFASVLCMLKKVARTNESSPRSKVKTDKKSKLMPPVGKTREYPIQESRTAARPGWNDVSALLVVTNSFLSFAPHFCTTQSNLRALAI